MPTILIVDDEASIVDALRYNLEKLHYQVLIAMDGETALQVARRESPDLIVLDLMLPGLDGIEVCRILRSESDLPIIMLTARDEEVDRVVGLEIGADDYVVKPFSMRELTARIKSVLRRSFVSDDKPHGTLKAGDLKVDTTSREVYWQDEHIQLSKLEFELLAFLLRHHGQALARDQLLVQVWGYDFAGDTRAVDTAIKRLRSKLKSVDSQAARMILTVRGHGYKLDAR